MRASASVTGVAVVLLASVSSGARADADALVDAQGPREMAVGGSLRAGSTGSLGVSLNPSGLPFNQELVFEGGYGYRAADRQSVIGFTACDSTNAMPGCFFYNYVGGSPEQAGSNRDRRTHTAGLALSRFISPQVAVGTTVKYFDYNTDLMDEADASGFTFDSGITAQLTPMISLGVVGYNVLATDSANFPRAIGGGALTRPVPQLTLSFDGLWNLDADGKTGRYGGGMEYFVAASKGQLGIPLRVGGVYDVAGDGRGYATFGLGLASMKMGFDVGASKQVSGGEVHEDGLRRRRIQASQRRRRAAGHRQPALLWPAHRSRRDEVASEHPRYAVDTRRWPN